MHEWPLLIFTIFIQAAVGGVLILWIFQRINVKIHTDTYPLLRQPLIVVSILSLAGLAASFAHLGSIENSFHAVRGMGSSWMSREIISTGTFIGFTCMTTGLALVRRKVNTILLFLSTIIGLGSVFSMGVVYSETLVNGWNHIHTYLAFFGSCFTLGAVLIVGLIAPALNSESPATKMTKIAFFIAVVGISIEAVGVALYSLGNFEIMMINGNTVKTVLEGYQMIVGIRWIVVILGVGLLGYLTYSSRNRISQFLSVAALIAVLAAEGISRYVFYVIGA
ncbi:DmsC/YnfH family molybdoenzyme membrane anchor subunit [Bacillus sp. REN3]|uniref:dimethyl sulfoxide reductase anchor subunit family protein n=1 Tax=Bacillus sp. REN3 TaxID=2802440 RepID=UPI001AEDFB62|nr:DmsC/YnfH family molybdoenzyme membrane anchor subunit [Bacillus sp. REN3]